MLTSSADELRAPADVRAANEASLNAMVAFCDEEVECRRGILLHHFGEPGGEALCRGTCDVCASGAAARAVTRDVSAAAAAAVRVARALARDRLASAGHLADVLRGSTARAVRDRGHDGLPDHGALKGWAKGDAGRLLRRLVAARVLAEETSRADNEYGSVTAAIRPADPGAADVEAGRRRVEMTFVAGGGPGGAPARGGRLALEATDSGSLPAEEALARDVARSALTQLNAALDERTRARRRPPAGGGEPARPVRARVVLPPEVVDRLVALRPADQEALQAAEIPRLSRNQRATHGPAVLAALAQAAAYASSPDGRASGADGFRLDTSTMWPDKRKRATASASGDGWADDGPTPDATAPPPPKRAAAAGVPDFDDGDAFDWDDGGFPIE
jgi:superfamily II DNA helicase RecQ